MEIRYRDQLLRKVVITINDPTGEDYQFHTRALVTFDVEQEQFVEGLKFDQLHFEANDGNFLTSLKDEVARLAKWQILTGSYRQFGSRTEPTDVKVYHNNGKSGILYRATADHVIRLNYPPLARLPIEESKLARRIVIAELYHAGVLKHEDIIKKAHFPETTIEYEINGLRASRYVSLANQNSDNFLTTEGREHFESDLFPQSGVVFIIAACPKRSGNVIVPECVEHSEILELYVETLQQQGFVPRFQENEEPKKNIYQDIFDYIDLSEFVVADITWQKPNCYIEIGYALSKQKRIILFVEENYFKDVMGDRLPFDISLIKYQTYVRSAEGIEKLKRDMEERIAVIRKDFSGSIG